MLNNRALAASASTPKLYVEDVFSTYLYTGNGSTQTITNGIDLSGKGGLVWIKRRNSAVNPELVDTARGNTSFLRTDSANGELISSTINFSFLADGFSQNNNFSDFNLSGGTYASWTFRKAAKFFDVVTATTTSTTATITHNLGSVPGAIIRKRIDSTSDWFVWHRSLSSGNLLYLNLTLAQDASSGISNVTSTSFDISGATGTYVFYIFAHDAGGFGDSGNDNVISCGSYTGNGSTSGPTVTLGWEPQWLLVKRAGGTGGSWFLFDSMRGIADGGDDTYLQANASDAEILANYVKVTSTGFAIESSAAVINSSGTTFIYIAIRRGPMKTPTAGTDVFYAELESQTDLRQSEGVPFPPDLVNTFSRNGTDRTSTYNFFQFCDRLRGLGTPNNTFAGGATDAPVLISSSTGAENDPAFNTSFIQLKADGQNITGGTGWNSTLYGNYLNYFFRRAPGFFDVVAYAGNSVAGRTLNHNLGVSPELMIIKSRSNAVSWFVYSAALGANYDLILNSSNASSTPSNAWNNTSPTSSVLTLGTDSAVNLSGRTYIAYLFATCPGVSKVGSYTGSGGSNAISVDCGFTNGARFVLIKRTDSTGDWYVWDTARGIVSGNDPYLLLNSTAAEVANEDYIDPYPAGFEISPSAPFALRGSSFTTGTFIYLAIA